MREAGIAGAEIGRKLLPANMQFKARSLVDASRRWAEPDLRRAMSALARADRRIKRGSDAETALVAAVVEACGADGGEARPSPRRGR